MNTEKIQIHILTYERREAEHSCRTNYCRLQVFDTCYKPLRNVTPGLCTKPGVRAGADGQLCNAELGSGSGSFLWDTTAASQPSELFPSFHLQASAPVHVTVWRRCRGCDLHPAQITRASSPAQTVLCCCCPEQRSNPFHELELPKLADFVHPKLDPSWCVKWCLK